jgi:hypothetical protein
MPKFGPERGFANADHGLLANGVEAVAETNRGGGLAFTGRRRVDRRHQDQVAILVGLDRFDEVCRDLCLGMTIRNEIAFLDTNLCSDLLDRLHVRLAGDFDV